MRKLFNVLLTLAVLASCQSTEIVEEDLKGFDVYNVEAKLIHTSTGTKIQVKQASLEDQFSSEISTLQLRTCYELGGPPSEWICEMDLVQEFDPNVKGNVETLKVKINRTGPPSPEIL